MKKKKYKKIIKKQNEIIGNLSWKNEFLNDSVSKRKSWLRQAKKDAGFNDDISFDDVWKLTLNCYLKEKNENPSISND